MSVVTSAVTGIAIKLILDRTQNPYEITWKEYAIVMVVISFLAAPGSVKLGWELAKTNKLTYGEYWNGWEVEAIKKQIECERDGDCECEYDCDPYIVMMPYSCNCNDKGSCSTCYRPETRYHSCPYVDVETDYIVRTTIGEYLIGNNRLPDDPQKHRWRKNESIPESVIRNAGTGPHPFWVEAKKRLDKNLPGPVTKRVDYENYIYASDRTILKQYSGEIKKFSSNNLLPNIQSGISQFYYANKVYFVGFRPKEADEWQRKLSYFNAALGRRLQGDLHLVIIQNELILNNPDEYAIALKAHWQNNERFEKNAFSKNAIAVLIGTIDGRTISWARAFTGMPMGNEELSTAVVGKFKGLALDPGIVIGDVQGVLSKKVISEKHGKGVLEDIVFGISEEETKFRRVSMKAKDRGDNGGGFLYLMTEIKPTSNQQILIVILTFVFCCFGWIAAVFIGDRAYHRY